MKRRARSLATWNASKLNVGAKAIISFFADWSLQSITEMMVHNTFGTSQECWNAKLCKQPKAPTNRRRLVKHSSGYPIPAKFPWNSKSFKNCLRFLISEGHPV